MLTDCHHMLMEHAGNGFRRIKDIVLTFCHGYIESVVTPFTNDKDAELSHILLQQLVCQFVITINFKNCPLFDLPA